MTRCRLAIFDFDGTLADSFGWFIGVVNQVADRHRFRRIEAHEVDTLRGYESRRLIQHLRVPAWKVPLIAREMRRRMSREIGGIALFPGVGEMLEALAGHGVTSAIVTSNSAENVRAVLGERNAALIRHWQCGVSLQGKASKLRRVLRAAGVPAAEAICIGDEIRDLKASRAVGIPFGAVEWGYTHPAALQAHAPEVMFAAMADIVPLVIGPASITPSR